MPFFYIGYWPLSVDMDALLTIEGYSYMKSPQSHVTKKDDLTTKIEKNIQIELVFYILLIFLIMLFLLSVFSPISYICVTLWSFLLILPLDIFHLDTVDCVRKKIN